MKKLFIFIFGASVLPYYAGCGSALSHYKTHLSGTSQAEFGSNFRSSQPLPTAADQTGQILQKGLCRTRYHPSYEKQKYMVVSGRLENGHKEVPVILDTGASRSVFVRRQHVVDNNLPMTRLSDAAADQQDAAAGQCRLSRFTIGELDFLNWPCLYLKPPGQRLNPLFSHEANQPMIVGLAVMRKFRYIQFDNLQKEVTFSMTDEFSPESELGWKKCPMYLEEDLGGNVFLFVSLEIQGRRMDLQLDTGSGNGLLLSSRLWKSISEDFPGANLKKNRMLFPYIGNLPCHTLTLPEIALADQPLTNAAVAVFPDNSPVLKGCDGMLGMGYFNKMNIVLDFWNETFWIRQQSDPDGLIEKSK